MNFGLLGKTLTHSFSPQIHSFLGNYTYDLFEEQPENLSDFFQNGNFVGINVTIPYKKDVIPFCHELTDCAKKLGSVNTIIRQKNGTLLGHNTDYFGFHSMVQRINLPLSGKKVLVLGSGGASVTAVAVLKELGAVVVVISRSGPNNYSNLSLHADASVIVNTTPVGMYPNTGISPICLDLFPHLEGVLDIIYNPSRTQLLLDAEKRGIPTENGLWMLVAQAKESAEMFTGQPISNDTIGIIYDKLQKQTQNIVLIGMPGCGKTTVGKCLAETLNRRFIDIDDEIVKASKMTIPEIFAQHGEQGFRTLETQTLAQFGKQSGLVLSTGGGCVTKSENYPLLHQNGVIFWLQRDINALPTDGRPLSKINSLDEMYRIRSPLYKHFADHIVSNNQTISSTLEEITKRWEL